jgi:hypothetical protein
MTHIVLSTTHSIVTSNTILRDPASTHSFRVDQESPVGIATRYGPDGPGIESRLGRDFPHPSRPVLGSTQPHVQKRTTAFLHSGALTIHPHLASRLKKEYNYTSIPPSVPLWQVIQRIFIYFQ